MRASKEQLASILDTAIDGIVTVDDDQRIVLFNAAAEKIFRCSAAEAIGQPIDRFIPERFRPAHRDQVRAFGQGEVSRATMGVRTVYGLRADGEEFPMEASISKVELGGRNLYTVIHRDVTESIRANERLVEQAALLDQSHEAIVVRDLIQQVLMNLCVNARDAMPNGGELMIQAENQILDEIYAGMLPGAYAGKFIVITVTDTGTGIPPEIIDRIFDPFFTTKAPGRGTGLGLATVQGIITNISDQTL